MNVSSGQALRAYAARMNTKDISCLEPLLADEFYYASQWVLSKIESKKVYLEYIVPKLDVTRKSGSVVGADMGSLEHEFPGPWVVVNQDEKDNLIAVTLDKVEDRKIRCLDLFGTPSPHSVNRTWDYPGLKKLAASPSTCFVLRLE